VGRDQDPRSEERQDKTIPQTGEYLGDLSFDYDVDGSVAWKPVRVYNDGRKTIIEMPKAMQQTESPSLLVVRKDGGLFTDENGDGQLPRAGRPLHRGYGL
jgi:type IV secretory pathway VirB9-like protein